MPNVLILDAKQRSALAVTRSLGRKGLIVHAADAQRATLAGASRFCTSELVYPDPATRSSEFTDWVVRTARDLRASAVIPLTDLTIMLLSPLREQFDTTLLLCPPDHAYNLVSDKARLVELARANGIRVPATRVATTISEIAEYLSHCEFPVVIKPARSKINLNGEVVATSVSIFRTKGEALAALRAKRWAGHVPCLIQQYIEGHGAGLFTLYSEGTPVAWFAHKRLREKPPSGGVSVLSQSVPVDDTLRSSAKRLLDAAGWNGPAMIEFKVTPKGEAYLMEINGRFWGSLQLAIDCGIDFPWLMYAAESGEPFRAPQTYAVGQSLRWLLGDFDSFLISLKDAGISKLDAARAFLRTFFSHSTRQEVLRYDDPAPGLREIRSWIVALGK